ncbi:MAG TPA: tetratricopeptide repeat protein [Thermoanaerobaculia bacterium]
MQPPILRIFVSSTWLDLQPERGKVRDALDRLKTTKFVGMEFFGSRDQTTRQASLDEVDDCNIYLGILAGRYGSGITEDEYRRARKREIPCFLYFRAGAEGTDDRLASLKDEIRAAHLVSEFTSPDDLAAKVTADLSNWIFRDFVTPRLEDALQGRSSSGEAQSLLDQVRDAGELDQSLRARLRSAGYTVLAGEDVVYGDKNVYISSSAVSSPTFPPPRQLRAPVGDFIDRESERERLKEALIAGAGQGVIVSISGIGGSGKTELALKVAHMVTETYPDAQLFATLHSTDERAREPYTVLEECIRAFVGTTEKLPDKNEEELSRRLRSILSGRRALTVLDNAPGSEQVRPFLPPVGCALIVTSPKRMVLPGVKCHIELTVLRPDVARGLLRQIAPRVPDEVTDRIVELCGYLPLAIRAAGSLLAIRPHQEPKDYADKLADRRTRLAAIGRKGVELSVEACFNLSYQDLEPETAAVFRKLAVFPGSFDAAAEEAVCGDPGQVRLDDLLEHSLVDYIAETRRFHLQSLVSIFADSHLGEDERETASSLHARHYAEGLHVAHELFHRKGGGLQQSLAWFDLEQSNILQGQAWAERRAKTDDVAAALCIDYALEGENLIRMRLHPKERVRWIESALAAAQRLKRRVEECRLLGHLGCVYQDTGDLPRTAELHEKQLQLAREIPDRQQEGLALSHLGSVKLFSETEPAIELLTEALGIFRDRGNRYHEGSTLNHLGSAYTQLGDYPKAIEYHERQLSIARDLEDLRGLGKALNNLANAYWYQGKLHRARELYEERVKVAGEIGHRNGISGSLGNLALTHTALGRPRQALELCTQALAISRDIGDRQGESVQLEALAGARFAMGELDSAIKNQEKAIEIFKEQSNRSYEGTARGELADMYLALGDPRRALDLGDAALAIAEEGRSDYDRAHALVVQGKARLALGDPGHAAELCDKALDLFRDKGSRQGECTALVSLGSVRLAQGDAREAIDLLEKALVISRDIGTRRDESRALHETGKAHLVLGDPLQAASSHRQALEIAREVGDRLIEGEALLSLSRALDQGGDSDQAAVQAESAQAAFEQIRHYAKASEARECLSRLRAAATR